MGAYRGLSEMVFGDIVGTAEELGYSDANLLILRGDRERLAVAHPEVYDKLLGCEHNYDSRDPFEYAQDLVANWVFEDWFVAKLRERGVDIQLCGGDKDRELLASDHITGHSDTEVLLGGKYVGMELVLNFTGYWIRTGKIDLHDNKFINLKRHNCLLCAIDLRNRKFTIIDPSSPSTVVEYDANHEPWGGKPCYSIVLSPFELEPFCFDSVVKRLKFLEPIQSKLK